MLNWAMDLLVHKLPALVRRYEREDRGQTLVEYGLLLVFIAIVVIVALILLGPAISGMFKSVNDQL
jgi:pilus assembly protein Flp/PilA